MSDPWTHTRSRLANAARRLRADGSTPAAEADFKAAAADHAAARLEFAICQVHARGIDIGDQHRLRLIQLLGADFSDDKPYTDASQGGAS